MVLLLGGSAFFSGSETAFFNLSRKQVNQFKKSTHRVQNLAARLLGKPKRLLSCFLFGNTTVNILYYALASVLAGRFQQEIGVSAGVVTAFGAFALLVLFGEIVPKSVAYANSKSLSIATAVGVFALVKLLGPVLSFFRFVIIDPAVKLFLGPVKHPETITPEEFKSLIEEIRKQGLISADENRLISEVIKLGYLKVRHVMRPRVDMVACSVRASGARAIELMRENGLTKLPVYIGTKDNIVGTVSFRQLLLRPEVSVDKLVQRVYFVPEQKSVESLLEFFRRARIDMAVVVDEYGGIAGLVSVEDIAEELLGWREVGEGIEPVEQTGPFEYRLAGDLAIHAWAGIFNVEPMETRVSTIGGLVTALLGRIPKRGDVAYLKNLKFVVERIRKHRIETLILTLNPTANDNE